VTSSTAANPRLWLTLHLADNALILGQRNAEWAGHGPALEEDIALANMSLDLIGQARMLYQYAAELEGKTEDHYAYFRDAPEFRNFTLCELPHSAAVVGYGRAERDYAVTLVRNFLFSSYMVLLWSELEAASDPQLAAIAAKSLKEARYHLRHASDWCVRLGDGTDESHARMQAALNYLVPLTQEWFENKQLISCVLSVSIDYYATELKANFEASLSEVCAAATLQLPAAPTHSAQFVRGADGVHSEHLSFLLAEMQSVARAHPGAQW
jgi:ring-1,2-phenylacetyl-CoA epoxidase subunit PaaC